MTTRLPAVEGPALLHHRGDGLLVVLAAVHGALVLLWPAAPVIALGLWWNSNTISHNFIHRPFFERRSWNSLFSLYLTLLLGIPQSLWRARHLAHHGGWRLAAGGWRRTAGDRPPAAGGTVQGGATTTAECATAKRGRARATRPSAWARARGSLALETVLVLSLWAGLLVFFPRFFLTAYLPGYLAGLVLCALHGHYEHAWGTTQSHYGRLYNLLFFNDGYHVEHHRSPGIHWSRLSARRRPGSGGSPWPPVLRWLEGALELLERPALRSKVLQRFLVERHQAALGRLLPGVGPVRRVAIVGGGLFPRTALVLKRLVPEARLLVVEASARNIALARPFLDEEVEFLWAHYRPELCGGFDLVVLPLAYRGDREAIYRRPPAPAVLVHDWLWRRRGEGTVVSLLLLKRLNLVRQ